MFTYYSLKKFVPFLKSFMQKKDNKIGNKTAYKEERQIKEKKRAREKDRNRFAKKQKKQVQILACAHAQKNKKKGAKKFVTNRPGQVDFAVRLVVFVLNLPNGQVLFFWKFKLQKDCNQSY